MSTRLALLLLLVAVPAAAQSALAPTPPMGWNSWDAFGTTVTEDEVKANADYMAAHLKAHGWQYVAVFNLGDPAVEQLRINGADVGLGGTCLIRDLWGRTDIGMADGGFTFAVPAHGAGLYRLTRRWSPDQRASC